MLAFFLGRCFVVLLKQWIHQEFGQLKGFLQLVQKWDFEFSTFSFYKCVQLFELFEVWDSQWLMWLKLRGLIVLREKKRSSPVTSVPTACVYISHILFRVTWILYCLPTATEERFAALFVWVGAFLSWLFLFYFKTWGRWNNRCLFLYAYF